MDFWDAFLGCPGQGVNKLGTVVDQHTIPLSDSVKTGQTQSGMLWGWPEVFRLYGQGLGYRAVANALATLKVSTTKSGVERLVKGKAPYPARQVTG